MPNIEAAPPAAPAMSKGRRPQELRRIRNLKLFTQEVADSLDEEPEPDKSTDSFDDAEYTSGEQPC